jgi:hypothetical protein
MNVTLRLFAVFLVLLPVVFSAGWYAEALGPKNPLPWAITRASLAAVVLDA